jgi:hypothetical protein
MAARTAPEPAPQSKTRHQSAAFKKEASLRMKKLWKTKRNVMLKGVRKGSKRGQAARKANRRAAIKAAATVVDATT